ncbi:diguanylate cyclase [Lachnotalea glycerini]|uniref:Stage 0 sporulation protein A homolog n=1 Tax=Lachnotalea glycerini TaxID=1763509 RepID=A0A371JHA5_9FIRM|nr:diguanylate cyclase [Lachnotalea glycerini]RDY32110.1 diguanylate cyclase [Lachnotalea glycerini]
MKRKILAIDDSKMNLKILSDILMEEDYDVYTLLDGINVIEAVLNIQPDAILLDIIMPSIDGIDVCTSLKNTEETSSIPVIMVTAVTEGKVLRQAFDIGAFDYIKKPYDQIEIVARLKSAIRYYDQQKKLESLAMKDGLTNLYNHRMIMELFEKEFNKAIRQQYSIAFMMFDIDLFKKVNDTYGHKIGDCVLKNIANVLKASLRTCDFVGRYGGEEFCIIVSNQSFESVLQLSERIRATIDHYIFEVGNNSMHITISIGVAYKEPISNISHNELIIIADQKLYEAKKNGRNRVECQLLV